MQIHLSTVTLLAIGLPVLLVFILWLLAQGIRCYQVSGFRFYLVANIIQSVGLVVGLMVAVLSDLKMLPIVLGGLGIMLLGYAISLFVRISQSHRSCEASPVKWNAWVDKAKRARQSSRLDNFLLPPISKIDT